MFGISKPHFLGWINGIIIGLTYGILCHTVRAWQTGGHLETSEFNPDALAGEPDSEPGVLVPAQMLR